MPMFNSLLGNGVSEPSAPKFDDRGVRIVERMWLMIILPLPVAVTFPGA